MNTILLGTKIRKNNRNPKIYTYFWDYNPKKHSKFWD